MLEMRMSSRVKPEIFKCRLSSERLLKIAYFEKNVKIVLYLFTIVKRQSCSRKCRGRGVGGRAFPGHVTSVCYVIRPSGLQVRWMGVQTNRDRPGNEFIVFDGEISDRDTHKHTPQKTRVSIRRAYTQTQPESNSPAWNTLTVRKRRQVTCHHVQEKEVYHNTYCYVSQLKLSLTLVSYH